MGIVEKSVTKPFIPLAVPSIQGNAWTYVKDCLDTGWVSSVGSYVDRFESMTAARLGLKHAVAAVNGTAALHTALLVAGVAREEEVVVSTLTFIAPVNAIRYVGAWPVFIDAEATHAQMDVGDLTRFLNDECQYDGATLINRKTGRRVRAVMPVHVLGHACDMEAIADLARRFNLIVIEDASEALGTRYKGDPVGRHGDFACISYNGNKLLTTGGGGMLLTDNAAFARKAKYLTTQAKDDPIAFVHGEIGYNYRMTNMAAALGCAQMEMLDTYVSEKRRIAATYRQGLCGIDGIVPLGEANWCESTHWMFTVEVDADAYGRSSKQLLAALDAEAIQTRPLWQPMHLSPAHATAAAMTRNAVLKTAERLVERCLSLPCSVGLTAADQARVIATVKALAKNVQRRPAT